MHTEHLLDLEAKEVSSSHSRMGHGALEIDILPVCRILHASIGMAFVLSIDVSKHILLPVAETSFLLIFNIFV